MSEIASETVNERVERAGEGVQSAPVAVPAPVPVAAAEAAPGRSRRRAADAVAPPSEVKTEEEPGREVRL